MTAMQMRVTAGQHMRNLSVIGHDLALTRLYSKTRGVTGMDKMAPTALDGFTSGLMLMDLTVGRPFAEFVIRQCYPDKLHLQRAAHNNVFLSTDGIPTSALLSDAMGELTLSALGFPITLLPYRHAGIALRRKLCPFQKPENFLGDDELGDQVGAAQTGHSVRVEGMHYAVTALSKVGVYMFTPLILLLLQSRTLNQIFLKMPCN